MESMDNSDSRLTDVYKRQRKYIAERCDLIGAVRLPNNAFKGSGTKIMTDVI